LGKDERSILYFDNDHGPIFLSIILKITYATPTMITKINKSVISIFSSTIVVWFQVKTAVHSSQKAGLPAQQSNPASSAIPGSPAISLRSVAFRPLLTKGLALS
jgi:hypothetical protein